MSATPATAEALEAFLRRLAPRDLEGLPLYVVLDPPADRCLDHAEGFTMVGLDACFRDLIGDRWRGRGPALAVNTAAVRDACHFPDDAPDRVRAVAMHELAHVLVAGTAWYRGRPDVRRPGGRRLAEGRSIFRAARAAGPPATPADPAADVKHGDDFIRVGCHLLYRAEALGVSRADLFPRVVVTDESRPRYVGAHKYAAALGDEPARMAGASFAEVLATPTPPALVALWRSEFDPPRPAAAAAPRPQPEPREPRCPRTA